MFPPLVFPKPKFSPPITISSIIDNLMWVWQRVKECPLKLFHHAEWVDHIPHLLSGIYT